MNARLDRIAQRPKRALPVDFGLAPDPHDGPGEPLVESTWVDPYPDERHHVQDGYASPEARYERRESVELAFIVALQKLPATQRAALILRVASRQAVNVATVSGASAPGRYGRSIPGWGSTIPWS